LHRQEGRRGLDRAAARAARVYWSNRPGVRPRREYEAFTCHVDAEAFLELIAALGGDPLAARAYVRRDQLDADPGSIGPVPALRLDTLRNVYLGTKSAVHPETRDRYAQLIDDHIIGYFGADFDVTLMRAIPSLAAPGPRERMSVSGWLEWMQRQHARSSSGRTLSRLIAPKTIRNVHAVLSEMLDLAVDDPDIRLDRNPCAKSRLPKVPVVEMQFLEKAQFARLLPLFNPYYRPLVLTLVMTGIRWGEAAGLQMKNLHLDAPVLYLFVCKALRRPKGGSPVLGRPKSDASVRQIPLNPKLVEELRRHTVGLAPSDFVFRMRGGGLLHNGNFHLRE
jgi:integrase